VAGFLGADYAGMLRGHRLPDLREVVVLAGEPRAGTVAAADLVARGDGAAAPAVAVAPEAISHIQFTSGTTGRPKGAMLRHRAMCGTTRAWCATTGLRPGDRYLVISPMFHISGHKTGVLACLTAGATILPQPVFDPVVVMQRVAAEGITVLPGPPTIYQTLLEHPARRDIDLTSLRLAVTGAASIPPVLVERMRDDLGFATVITAYGTTEATGVVTMCRPDDDAVTVATTSGRAVPGVEVRIDEVTGEILVRGYNVMAGYLDDAVATAAAIDEEGWFHTGDVGALDGDGNLRITDRLTDVFLVGGFNAYPAEIEAMMLRHPGVVEGAAIGVPDPPLGEVGPAFVVPRTGARPDAAALLAWLRDQLANYKVPRTVTFVETLPRNASGKVLKYELRGRGPVDG
jgi:acyl-CoA synthetase (AMP-forming)/AMP-acid ligase II